MRYLLKNAKFFSQGVFHLADVFLSDGKIVSIGDGVSPSNDTIVIDISNMVLFPGFVDVHVHLREPGFSYKETIRTGTLAAAHGGFAHVAAMPNLNPVPDTPAHLVEQLARGKCLAVSAQHPGAVVIGCDTVVDVNGEVFGKPHSEEDAKRMLRALSGAAHEVHTGVCISDGTRTESFVDSCRVTFFPLSGEEIDFYASTAEPYDKAGAYAIQGRAALWLDRIEGDYYTIMGLPVSRTVQLLAHFM